MDLTTFNELLMPAGQEVLAAAAALAPTDATLLSCIARLRERFHAALTRGAVETVLLRQKAANKFSHAAEMYFTRLALEQSSGEQIARHRAERFRRFGRVGDFCCGVGGDTIALAGRSPVVAVDSDPLRLAMAAANVDVYGLRERASFIEGDLLDMPLPAVEAAFFDPDRRTEGRRHISLRGYRPSIDAIRARLPANFPLGIKVAPAVPWQELDALPAAKEFISVDGELKECVLWFGELRSAGRRATVLPGGYTLSAEAPGAPSPLSAPLEYLYDPDPAITRAGLVADLALQLGAALIDPQIAFLTSPTQIPTPFARAYRVVEALPFHLKRLAERLRARDVGRITIIKRGSAVDADDLTRKLKLVGAASAIVILTRVQDKPFVVIAEEANS
jgi:THUMP domain-like/RNA cap guanine-N2 methyltransferase